MRIVFSVLNLGYLRFFEEPLVLLAERGHDVCVLHHEGSKSAAARVLADRLSARVPDRFEFVRAQPTADDLWCNLGLGLRSAVEYLQFLEPRYHDTYRARAEVRAPAPLRRLGVSRLGRSAFVRRAAATGLRTLERATPASDGVLRTVAELRPDAICFSPYVGLSTVQPDYMRAARALGVPTAVCVASWDNLSSKILIRPVPRLVTVWNETQAREALELHRLPREAVAITGAQCFDHWFEMQPGPREDLCARAGLDPARPYVLYTCFTPFKGDPPESVFLERWLTALRRSPDAMLRDVGVLVRPHPKRPSVWEGFDVERFGNVAIWPPGGDNPVEEQSRRDYFDSIAHSAAVVGLNTSALIEAGIVGRPVLTVLAEEHWRSQEGTFHFRYLVEAGGGLLHLATDLDEHLGELARSIRGETGHAERSRAFVEAFVRPHGIDVPATPVFADALQRLAAEGHAQPVSVPLALRPLRPAVSWLARRATAERAARARSKQRRNEGADRPRIST